jgi:PAS domain S-box-containing protein
LGANQHPKSLGVPISESTPTRWGEFEAIMLKVFHGDVFYMKDLKTNLNKNGTWEESFLDLNLSPIFIDDDTIGGVQVIVNESTERVQAILALENSEKRFKDLITHAPVAISVFRGPDFIAEVANKLYLLLIGKTEEEFVGKPLFEALPEARELIPIAKNLMQTGEPFFANEYPLIINKNGKQETCYFTAIWEPVRGAENKIDGFMAVVTDVTQQVAARKRTEASEVRLKNLVSESLVPTAVFAGPDMVLELVNDAMLNFWEFKGKDIIGKPLIEFLPEMVDQPFPALLKNVYETGETYVAEEAPVFLNARGKIYVDFSYKAMRNDNAEINSILVQAIEVSEKVLTKEKLIHSKESLRNTILNAPVAMCILRGPNHVVEIANKKFIELLGKTEEVLIDNPIFEVVPEAKNQGFDKLLNNVYQTGVSFNAEGVPVQLLKNNKLETLYLNYVYEPLKENDNTITGIIVVANDVTSQIEANNQIEEKVNERTIELAIANKNLEKSNAELAQFAYIASHDLQEPLRKIKVFTHLLSESVENGLKDQSKIYFEKINSATTRMNTLIRDVLVYSQVAKEKKLFEEVNLNTILKGIVDDFDLLIEQKKASISIEKLPVISAIPQQMTQLFGNLIGNSLKFSRKDVKPKIEITATEIMIGENNADLKLTPGSYWKIQVKDNGIGFKKEYSDQIFSIFQRLHNKSEYEGTGIGLAMCKKIALNHNGNISSGESSEEGAVFKYIYQLINLAATRTPAAFQCASSLS